MKKIISIVVILLLVAGIYAFVNNSQELEKGSASQSEKEFKFKPAKFRLDTPFMCGANISRQTAKLYFDSSTLKVEFDNRQYISNKNGGIHAELTYYVTSDNYTNPNQLYMEVEKDGSSLRISGESVTPKGIVYSCFEVDEGQK